MSDKPMAPGRHRTVPGRRRTAPDTADGTRRLPWVAAAGALIAVVLAVVTVVDLGDDDRRRTPPAAAPRRDRRPADILAGLRTSVAGLVGDGQLSARDGAGLDRRLGQVGDRLANGQVDRARKGLRAFTDKVGVLRRKGRLSAPGHQLLLRGVVQLAAALSKG